MTELHELTAMQQREMLERGELLPSELTAHYLGRIEQLNGQVHAFTTVTAEAAMERAVAFDAAGERPSRGEAPLWGMPFADKDLTDRAGVPTSYGSRAFLGYVPEVSSPIVTDMDAAGGISLGKTNVPEFGFPAYAENRLPEGPARNPWDVSRDPGGSSAGAAVAVAARMLPFAPGNDGGGSVRIPAAACGLVGIKPSRGRVPGASGIDSLGGLAVGGPLARTVGDAALLLDGMCHGPARFTLGAPVPESLRAAGSFVEALAEPVGTLRIGWNTWSPWATHYPIAVDPQVEEVFHETLRVLERLGHDVKKVEPTPFPPYVDSFRAIWMGGAASLPFPDDMLDVLEPLTAWLVRTGRSRPASELAGALAMLARFESQIISDYSPYDVVVTPMLSGVSPVFGTFNQDDGELNFVQQCQFTPFTSYLNVSGLPGISLPVAQVEAGGAALSLPVGVQAIGRPGDEVTLLRLGAQLEAELCWQDRIPAGFSTPGIAQV